MTLQGHRDEDAMQALATYLEIVENGGDGEVFLRSQASLEPEVRALAGLDANLRFELPEELFSGRERSRRQFLAAIQDDETTARALAWFKPRLFGIIGALGLGMGLTGAFASGALPTTPLSSFIKSLPVVGSASSPTTPPQSRDHVSPIPGVNPGFLERQSAPIIQKTDSTQTAETPAEAETPITSVPADGPETIVPRDGGNPSPPAPFNSGSTEPLNGAGQEANDAGVDDAPGQEGGNPGEGVGPEGTPPGQGGENPGGGVGPEGTPPGQGGENPGEGQGPPEEPPPGQGGENPGGGIGPDGTPPGQGGENPGQGNGQENDDGPGNSDGTPGGGNTNNGNNGNNDSNGNGQGNGNSPPSEDDEGGPGNSDGTPGGGNSNNGNSGNNENNGNGQGNNNSPPSQDEDEGPGNSDGTPGGGNTNNGNSGNNGGGKKN